MNRRALLSILAGGFATAVRSAAAWAAPIDPPASARPVVAFVPRGVLVESFSCSADAHAEAAVDRCRTKPMGFLLPRQSDMLISNGRELVPLESDEGQAIARESAVNLRSDGTLRHRQHHWPR